MATCPKIGEHLTAPTGRGLLYTFVQLRFYRGHMSISQGSAHEVFAGIATEILTKDQRKKIRNHYLAGEFDQVFPAGSGAVPTLLVGREQQLNQLSALVKQVSTPSAKRSIHGVLLHGPRGTGKTALIAALERGAQEHGGYCVIRADGNTALKSTDRFTSCAAPYMTPILEDTKSRKSHNAVAGKALVIEGKAGIESQISSTSKARSVEGVHSALMSVLRHQQKPVLLLIDEAHTAEPSVLGEMMNAMQTLGETHPIGFVLAGTPDTFDVLRDDKSESTWFRDRLQKERFAPLPNDLPIDTCRNAMVETLAAAGVSIKENSDLEAMLPRCKGSPYFLQALGQAALQAAQQHQDVADFSIGGEIDQSFEQRIQDRYKEMWTDLQGRNLTSCARQLGCLWRSAESHGKQIDDRLVASAIRSGLDHPLSPYKSVPSFEYAEHHLKHLGLLWSISGNEDGPWSLGLPSFFDFAEARLHASQHPQDIDVLSHLESDMHNMLDRLGKLLSD